MIKNFGHVKKIITAAAFTAIFVSVFTSAGSASDEVKKFKMIEFKDLYYLSKYEIIDNAGIKIDGKDIIVDLNLLRKALIEQPLVKSFTTTEEAGKLAIVIHENEPVFLFGFRDGVALHLFETDGTFRILSAGRVHALNMPLVIINKDDIFRNNLSEDVKNFLTMLRGFSNGKLSGLLREIDEIDLTDPQRAEMRLKGRRTVFIMAPDMENFLRLNNSVGYFDRIRYYPEVFEITLALGIIKKR